MIWILTMVSSFQKRKDRHRLNRHQLYRLKQQPIVSGALVIANVVVYILCRFPGNRLEELGWLTVSGVLGDGEYGRLIWSMFLHADLNHLASNMIILFFLGSMIEKEIGHIRYAVLYFLSGIGGGLLSLQYKVITDSMSASLGASGAVFGLDGVLLAMVLLWNERLPNVTSTRVMLMIVLSLYSGFTGGNIDNAAHIGGLLVGFLGGCVVCFFQRRKRRRDSRAFY